MSPPDSRKAAADSAALDAATRFIARRHVEYREHHVRQRWLLDSLEGGDRYRNAWYGIDRRGQAVRNLIRHKREYPDPAEGAQAGVWAASGGAAGAGAGGPFAGPFAGQAGSDPGATATDDDYELRRARTPVPTFLAEAINEHLDRVFAREVRRSGPAGLEAWWADVDGRGTAIGDWLRETVGPPLLAVGHIDVAFDRPAVPDGEAVATQADVRRLGLDRCIASYILPENMLWWRLDSLGRYAECLVREYAEDEAGEPVPRYRHWTPEGWTLYAFEAEVGPGGARREVVRSAPTAGAHPFGRVPIVRVFTGRNARHGNTGRQAYGGIAERQREYYNRDSELILSDTTQAHPLLQGPEDFVQADGTIPIGPAWLLPKKKNSSGGAATYEGFDVVDFPKDGAESIRRNKGDLRDEVDRDAALSKPAGAAGTGAGAVAQSGVSKSFDEQRLNNKLCRVADWFRAAERACAEMVLHVLADGAPASADLEAVEVVYTKQFDLTSFDDLGDAATKVQGVVEGGARLPATTAAFAKQMVRRRLTGLGAEDYRRMDDEIDAALSSVARRAEADAFLRAAPPGTDPAAAAGEADPAGQYAGSILGGVPAPVAEDRGP